MTEYGEANLLSSRKVDHWGVEVLAAQADTTWSVGVFQY